MFGFLIKCTFQWITNFEEIFWEIVDLLCIPLYKSVWLDLDFSQFMEKPVASVFLSFFWHIQWRLNSQ